MFVSKAHGTSFAAEAYGTFAKITKNNSRMEKIKLSFYYELRTTKSISYPKKIILAHKKLIRNRKIICVMDNNNKDGT